MPTKTRATKAAQPTRTNATNATDASVAAGLMVATTRLARRLRQLSSAQLTPSQHSAMSTINRFAPITLGELAERERVAQPTTSRVVAKLEAQGLVERRPDPDDGRIVRVVTTAAGAERIEAARSRKVAWVDEHMAQLTAEERARIAAALPALERLLELA